MASDSRSFIEPPAPTEPGQGGRSSGISYQELLDTDSRPVPDVLRLESARELPVVRVPIERYTSREFHDLEVEKVWKRVWQFVCREEEIPEIGDHTLYDIAEMVNDPHTKARGMIAQVPAATGGEFAAIGHPVKYSAASTEIKRGAPLIGHHSREVLAEFGFAEEEIEALIGEGAVGETLTSAEAAD